MLTRARRPVVSPSLLLNEPAARTGCTSPSLGADAMSIYHFRPVSSPSLEIEELMPSPRGSPTGRGTPSLGLIPETVMQRAVDAYKATTASASGKAKMTTASCKRASRMARPSEPSESAMAVAHQAIMDKEHAIRSKGREKVSGNDTLRFKLANASTGKGPAVRADSLDATDQASAQAKMNHVRCTFRTCFTIPSNTSCMCVQMVSIKSRSVDSGNQEPSWLINHQNTCPQMYGRLAASAIKRCVLSRIVCSSAQAHVHYPVGSNAVNSSVTKREKTQGAANQVHCKPRTHLHTVPTFADMPSATKAYRRKGFSTRKASFARQRSASTGCFRRTMSGIVSPATHLADAIAFSRRSL